MPDGQTLEFSGLSKRFGAVTAVAELTARVEPGRVTGFLGPNGAGKTTTLRILLGLVRPTEGRATIGGKRYAELERPLQTVGAVLEASSFHPGRTAAAHLTIYAQAAGIARSRVDEVLGLVGLADAASRKVGGFSLGMRQRLGLAYALLGDPGVLVLDEPANGLDPEGIRWLRGFLQQLAAEGRTVLVSSHLLAEVQQTVDALLIISRGSLVFQGAIEDLSDPAEHATVVDAPDRAALTAALRAADVPFEVLRSGLTVRGVDPATVGAAAAAAGVALSTLQRRGPALEEVFLDLVNGTRVHPSAQGAPAPAEPAVVPEPEPEPEAAPEPEAQPEPEPEAAPEPGTAEVPAESGEVVTPGAAYAVASTGVIDIIGAGEPDPWAPEDADPDVGAIGEIDDELSVPEPPESADDRPWQNQAKTESDREADAFFSAFDAGRNEPADRTDAEGSSR
ncbi:ATP-binding cassette domain-containing protein [Microbacterium timonense]|uniref:ATP-binding cassette domain-containing protein n=1 Tax=Microbacterium timonense TaxID=2086576 RepID=UPI000D1093E6|nr:ATP-binding cassette domain-containing protein [Microbacterium timonense]